MGLLRVHPILNIDGQRGQQIGQLWDPLVFISQGRGYFSPYQKLQEGGKGQNFHHFWQTDQDKHGYFWRWLNKVKKFKALIASRCCGFAGKKVTAGSIEWGYCGLKLLIFLTAEGIFGKQCCRSFAGKKVTAVGLLEKRSLLWV
ncbi:hypothetical protein LXL04_028806 [Taraxacum kok-saghyz]